jgi:hypothetical protein
VHIYPNGALADWYNCGGWGWGWGGVEKSGNGLQSPLATIPHSKWRQALSQVEALVPIVLIRFCYIQCHSCSMLQAFNGRCSTLNECHNH